MWLITLTDTEDRHVSFYARVSGQPYVNDGYPVVPTNVVNNQGNAFDPTTGQFTVPVNGTYFFAATTSSRSSFHANAEIVVDGIMICRIQSSINYEIGSCQAVTSLHMGQVVWLRCYRGSYYFSGSATSLTGFLIS